MDYALVKEQGVTFAVVVVKSHALNNVHSRDDLKMSYQPYFPGAHIILMAQNSRGVPQYYGKTDIVNFLSRIDHRRLPWKRKNI
ncbi:hypothetical protein [Jeotgalibacillus sp. R-1-5s-1]|uniref:hypothetical protein n=1 Tax=Jeotgalibacillus sp. R-1-5s-1 TaxID=2555897 RepID=UPI00106B041D|nr:hypothetical protein [Jeotgalibacillus sp. R-1-5s-1]TFD94317.1 hypothetical protein E2491_12790 [Jeotgalibacillus sp. R-1-5s-1]